MKKSIAFLLAAVMMVGNVYAKDITVTLNNEEVNFGVQQPVIAEGRTLIPLRGIFEKLGYAVVWDSNTKTATLSDKEKSIDVTANSSSMTVNKDTVSLDVPAQIINGSMMLPLRAVGEASGLVVEWNNNEKTVILKSSRDQSDTAAESTTESTTETTVVKNNDYVTGISADTAEYARTTEIVFFINDIASYLPPLYISTLTTLIENKDENAKIIKNAYGTIDTFKSMVNRISAENDNETKIKSLMLEQLDLYNEVIKVIELEESKSITEEASNKLLEPLSEKDSKLIAQLASAINQYYHKAEGFYLKNYDTAGLDDADTERLGEFIKMLTEIDGENLPKLAETDLTVEDVLDTPLYNARDMRETAKARDEAFAKIETEPAFAKRVEILYCANDMLEKAADVLEKYSNKKLTDEEAENYLTLYCELYELYNVDGADGEFKEIVSYIPSLDIDESFDITDIYDKA